MSDKKTPKRRIEVPVSHQLGARLDRLAEHYRASVPGSSFKATHALYAVLFVGIEAEEKRFELPPARETMRCLAFSDIDRLVDVSSLGARRRDGAVVVQSACSALPADT